MNLCGTLLQEQTQQLKVLRLLGVEDAQCTDFHLCQEPAKNDHHMLLVEVTHCTKVLPEYKSGADIWP